MAPRRKTASRRSRRGVGRISTPRSTLYQTINATLKSGEYHYWTAASVVREGTTQATLVLPGPIRVTAACTTPCTLVFALFVNESVNSTTEQWVPVYQTGIIVVSTNAQVHSISPPRGLDPREDYRWSALSGGTPLLAGWVSFHYTDPVGT